MAVTKLVLVRHGESQWNNENRFTGWYDVDLSDKGRTEAKAAGKLLKDEGFNFDFAYTSVLKRAIHTLWNILDELDQAWLPTEKSWKLNERHYGALTGLDKAETAAKHGEAQVKVWRRSMIRRRRRSRRAVSSISPRIAATRASPICRPRNR